MNGALSGLLLVSYKPVSSMSKLQVIFYGLVSSLIFDFKHPPSAPAKSPPDHGGNDCLMVGCKMLQYLYTIK